MCSKAKDLWLTQSVWNSTWESAVVIKRQGLMTLRNSTFNLPPSGVRSRRVNRSKAPEQDLRLCQLVVAHGGSLLVCVFYYRPHHLLFQDVLLNPDADFLRHIPKVACTQQADTNGILFSATVKNSPGR